MDYTLFIISFASVSFLPGLCMSLALSLGLSIGFKRSLPMMFGELLGVALVIFVCGYWASFVLEFELAFFALQFFGGLFLLYTAFHLFTQKLELSEQKLHSKQFFSLIMQGFLASISNPKAWIFMLALLPPFLTKTNLWLLASIILSIEFLALCTYSLGGSAFRVFLKNYLFILSKFSALCVAFLAFKMLYDCFFNFA